LLSNLSLQSRLKDTGPAGWMFTTLESSGSMDMACFNYALSIEPLLFVTKTMATFLVFSFGIWLCWVRLDREFIDEPSFLKWRLPNRRYSKYHLNHCQVSDQAI